MKMLLQGPVLGYLIWICVGIASYGAAESSIHGEASSSLAPFLGRGTWSMDFSLTGTPLASEAMYKTIISAFDFALHVWNTEKEGIAGDFEPPNYFGIDISISLTDARVSESQKNKCVAVALEALARLKPSQGFQTLEGNIMFNGIRQARVQVIQAQSETSPAPAGVESEKARKRMRRANSEYGLDERIITLTKTTRRFLRPAIEDRLMGLMVRLAAHALLARFETHYVESQTLDVREAGAGGGILHIEVTKKTVRSRVLGEELVEALVDLITDEYVFRDRSATFWELGQEIKKREQTDRGRYYPIAELHVWISPVAA